MLCSWLPVAAPFPKKLPEQPKLGSPAGTASNCEGEQCRGGYLLMQKKIKKKALRLFALWKRGTDDRALVAKNVKSQHPSSVLGDGGQGVHPSTLRGKDVQHNVTQRCVTGVVPSWVLQAAVQ